MIHYLSSKMNYDRRKGVVGQQRSLFIFLLFTERFDMSLDGSAFFVVNCIGSHILSHLSTDRLKDQRSTLLFLREGEHNLPSSKINSILQFLTSSRFSSFSFRLVDLIAAAISSMHRSRSDCNQYTHHTVTHSTHFCRIPQYTTIPVSIHFFPSLVYTHYSASGDNPYILASDSDSSSCSFNRQRLASYLHIDVSGYSIKSVQFIKTDLLTSPRYSIQFPPQLSRFLFMFLSYCCLVHHCKLIITQRS